MLAVVVYLAARHQLYGIEKAAPIDGFCPFGGVVGFLTLVSTGEFLEKIYWGSIILLTVTTVITIIFGRAFCGFICPLGALQEWIRALGKRIGFKKDAELQEKADARLRLLKYVTLPIIFTIGIPLEVFVRGLGLPGDVDTTLMLREFGTVYNLKNKEGGRLRIEDFRILIAT